MGTDVTLGYIGDIGLDIGGPIAKDKLWFYAGVDFARTRFNWARVLAKEYSTPLGWTLPIVLIGLYNIHNSTGLAERPNAVAMLRGLLGAVILFWLFVGFLKKTRSPVLSNAD